MTGEVAGKVREWTERRLVVRSVRQARAAEVALRARVAKAVEAIEAFNRRGRGKKRCEEEDELGHAVDAVVERYRVAGLLQLDYAADVQKRPVRRYGDRPARVHEEHQATVAVSVDEAAVEAAIGRLGWRLYGTNQPRASLSLEQAVWAYRSAYLVERSLGRLTGRPLSLTPMCVQRDDHATGRMRLLSIALRVLTLLEFVVRRQLATDGNKRAGLYAGNPKRETARPTAERLLEAFDEITLTIIETPQQTSWHLPSLRALQQRILDALGFSSEIYTRLCTVSAEPP